ncbi:MAG: Gfo/Idh/MocA family oxidoreductase [Clostridiales bacterium]|nr:Gfo/Idh/MocA family oxidoreductase [Clostridiales bacterium]
MSRPIKIGIAGIGRAGWGMHCEELKGREDKFEIVAACDLIESRRNKMEEKFGCKTYEKIEDMIADPNVELVDIATRSKDHFDHALLALKAGKSVILEKPMCLNYNQALKLKEESEKSDGQLYIRHNRRFDPDFLHVREIIASGILGDVYEIRLARHSYNRRDDWQTIIEHGGGQLLNWGPHIVDHALRFLESPVSDMYSDLKKIAAVGDAEDHLKIILKGQNGRLVDLEISGGVAIGSPTYRVFGSKGSLELTGDKIKLKHLDPEVELVDKKANPGTPGETFGTPEQLVWIEEEIPVKDGDNYVIWDMLYESIRNGAEYPISLDEALEVMKVISAAKKGTEFDN